MTKRTIRLGAGSAHEGDDLDAAKLLAEKGELDYIVFDCTSEKAISLALIRRSNGLPAFDAQLAAKLRAVAPACIRNGTRIIANAGGFDPDGAGMLAAEICRELGLKDVKIAYSTGGDVLDQLRRLDPTVIETGKPVSALGNNVLGALAYGGTDAIRQALAGGADIVLTQRAGDSEQFLAPMMHEFGWTGQDWDKIACGLGIGHLAECAAQLSGGYFYDPGYKDVPDMHRLGFPIIEMDEDGGATISKVAGTGGVISELTCREQLLYEIGDPKNYVHASGVVDFTTTRVEQLGPDRVRVDGTTGRPRTSDARVALAVREGYMGMSRIVYGGVGCYDKARKAAEMVRGQLRERCGVADENMRFDFIGVNALFDWGVDPSTVREVELRIAGRFMTMEEARKVPYFGSQLPCNGPAGGAWGRPIDQGGVEEIITFYSTRLPHSEIHYELKTLVS
ncbi:acyclic terpene utilization AtuA family protein [Bosea sp. (in: a-proteobacteria)]|uniref:acyclic terpene utilization AtuA family protein n=1 Tax=Bosea sp. (in: a-proteobacteria) TaxID=1871050 RepID=UPI0026031693|nr:acyclic terpene utilization AtuA family protein [Bosea sp. (in: a-proteobacteria)]MCO5092916.1 DUF1446 domain-containing protein [Bosea sp. (in: a-proteobacteria)]